MGVTVKLGVNENPPFFSLLAGGNLYFGRHIGRVEVGRSGTRAEKTACPKTHDFSGQKSTPVHKQTGFLIARVVVKRTIRYYLMWSELVTQEILPQLKLDMGDVKRTISRALSFLNFERKNDYFKARIGNHSDKSAKGRGCSSSFTYRLWKKHGFHRNCTVCERAKQTSFCCGHLPAQEHFIGLNCRAQGFMLGSRTYS